MALKAKVGTVMSTGDLTQTGQFKVAFKLTSGDGAAEETVRYCSPMGNNKQAFIAIPPAGSQVLCLYEDDIAKEGDMMKGYYYVGSVMGAVPGANNSMPSESNPPATSPDNGYVDKDKPGFAGPDIPEGKAPMTLKKDQGPWPTRFQDMYNAKGMSPEQMGLINMRGDTFMISNRYKGNKGQRPYQDHRIGIQSGSGKRFELVDSPIVDGIVMTNEHKGKDYLIWSTGMSQESPFAAGEYHMRTHGPVNLYTLLNRFHIWVEDGLNIEIENKSTPKSSYGPGINGDPTGGGLPNTGLGGYLATREGEFGNETTGCIQLWTHHNNISLSALEMDSVIHVHAPGPDTKVIIDTGGTVDIVAKGKITLQSDVEIELNAPEVDINGAAAVFIDAERIDLNLPHPPPVM